MSQLRVQKRNGKFEKMDLDKINKCVERACNKLQDVSASEIVLDASLQLFDGVKTSDIDKSLILSARSKIEKEPNYSFVAARLLLNCIYKEVFNKGVNSRTFVSQYKNAFIENIERLVKLKRLSEELVDNFDLERLAGELQPANDELLKYLGVQTLYDRYLIRSNDRLLETTQAFFMRVAMGICVNERADSINETCIEIYKLISTLRYMPSTPTLFNAGTITPQCSSCYLNTMEDSIDGIYGTIHDLARLSKYAGGLGVDVTPLRGTGGHIKGTNGASGGLIPWCKQINDMAVAVNQGGKRPGACAIYVEPWHIDIEEFIELKKNTGDDRRRCHDINTALWIPDLFMQRVEADELWMLFSPGDTPDLHSLYGEAFNKRYDIYERLGAEGKIPCKVIPAKTLWKKILYSLPETGHPWPCFKDAANLRYMNDHCGTVNSSNLCTEITLHTVPAEYSREEGHKTLPGEIAVCNLASLNLLTHWDYARKAIDFSRLCDTIRWAVRGLDNIIDENYYPVVDAEYANLKHRPIGLGCMGFSDILHLSGLSYESEEAVKLAGEIQEFIAYHAIEASIDLGVERGSYGSFEGSKWSKGILPQDTANIHFEETLDWSPIREKLKSLKTMRNSHVMAIAPTATISFICGCRQSIEPDFSVLWVYSTFSGNFTMIDEYFVQKAKALGIWGDGLLAALKQVDGDVSRLDLPPDIIKEFKTAFDIDYHYLVDAAAARQVFIDMGQSFNSYNASTSLKHLNDRYFYSWKKGLKTNYYLRNRSATNLEKSTVKRENTSSQEILKQVNNDDEGVITCSIEQKLAGCESCQ